MWKRTMTDARARLRRRAGRLMLASMLLAGLFGCGQTADNGQLPAEPEPEPELASPSAADARVVPLAFAPLAAELSVSPEAVSPETIGDVQAAYPLDGGEGEAIVYLPSAAAGTHDASEADGAAQLMLGYRSAAGTYAIGPIAYGGFVPSVEETSLDGSAPALKVAGICGANCPETYYIAEQDGMPVVLFRLQAHVTEADPDGDGAIELLASSGTAVRTAIIELAEADGAAARAADLADALGAASVAFEAETGLFAAYYAETAETICYRYDGSGLVKAGVGTGDGTDGDAA